jgi:phosphatidylinositol alpha-1,6-mannosyltransferase
MARVVAGAGAIVANSVNTAAMLQAEHMRMRRVEVVHPGVDTTRFRPGIAGAEALRRRLAPAGEILLLTVGRLQRRKGHDLVLQALARLNSGGPLFRYVIVGDGRERARLELMARDLGVAQIVTFIGAVPTDELPAYYAAADIFVHPNRVEGGDFEGFGIVFLEAAAAGLPVIAGASGGVPEAVADGVTGVLVSGIDVDELSGTLASLSTSADRRRTLGLAGRARAEREFTWERAAARVLAIHQEIAARASSSNVAAAAR